MVRPRNELGSLRFSRLEKERLLMALLLSLFAHLGVWGGYEAGKKTGLWDKLHWPLRHHTQPQPKPVVQAVDPTIFVDVSQVSDDAPKEAKYYSDKNSRAANPDAEIDSNQPKLTGKQQDVPKLEDVTRPTKTQPTPTPTPPQKPVEAKPAETQPPSGLHPGALQPGKIAEADLPTQEQKPPQKERPRTLREARQASQIPGMQMQQEGGVRRHALKSSLDAIATPFGAYDRALIEAISQRWNDILDNQNYAYDRTGKVTIYFRLNPDGSVSECKILNNSVGDVLGYICLESIEQSAPFGKWPPDMRRMIGANFREITFTFYYY